MVHIVGWQAQKQCVHENEQVSSNIGPKLTERKPIKGLIIR